jgi:hypothetical protein
MDGKFLGENALNEKLFKGFEERQVSSFSFQRSDFGNIYLRRPARFSKNHWLRFAGPLHKKDRMGAYTTALRAHVLIVSRLNLPLQ